MPANVIPATMTVQYLQRMAQYHRGEITKPHWLTAWEQNVDNAISQLATAYKNLSPTVYQQHLYAVTKMRQRTDTLLQIWLAELPFKTWEDLAAERPPSAADIFTYTVTDTEDFFNGPGVIAFVMFLDTKWPNFVKEFTQQCLQESDWLLAQAIPLTPEVRRILADPATAFAADNVEVLETKWQTWVRNILPEDAPTYSVRVLAAYMHAGFGNYSDACLELEYAWAEFSMPDFPEKFHQSDAEAIASITESQHRQIAILLQLWPG